MSERYKHSIFEVCQQLHDKCANGDPTGELGLAEVLDLNDWLRGRLETWSEGPETSSYDRCVKALVAAVLEETRVYLDRIAKEWCAPPTGAET